MNKRFTIFIALLLTVLYLPMLAACADEPEEAPGKTIAPSSSGVIVSKGEIAVKVVPMRTITPAIYLQMPNMDITFVDFEMTNNGSKAAHIIVESELQGYSEKAVNTIDIAPGETKTLGQTPSLKPDSIPREIVNTMLYYRITNGGTVIQEQTIPVKMYARDTMLWAVQEGEDWTDTSLFIAAFVTPHAAEIDNVVRKAAEYHPENSMYGYQCGECADEAWRAYTMVQVKAIYEALQKDYKIKYINSTIAYSNKSDAPQRVRLPAESLRTGSANCIDGTVLYAAALESMDMHPYVIITPGHAFLGYETRPDDKESMICLETTMTGSSTFEEATLAGLQELLEEENNGNLKAGKTQLISIQDLRSKGIMPMK
jgi:hypothetical protein